MPVDREHASVEQAQPAQMQHHFRHAAREEHAHGRMMHRAVGQHIDEARHAAVDVDPVVHCRPRQARRVRDGGNVQQQIRRAAERRMNGHRVADARGVRMSAQLRARAVQIDERPRRAHGHIAPHRLAGRRERGMRQRQAERFADDLRGGGRAEKLAAAARRGAGAAAEIRRFLQRDQPVREPRADGLDLAGVLAVLRRQA